MSFSTKGILFFLCLLLSLSSYAQQTYYVSNSGSDSNAGTSQSSAWKSISKINRYSFKPGDKILFRRGDRWNKGMLPRSSGAPGKLITIGAYGSGSKPIIAPTSGDYAISIRVKSYYRIENLHVVAPPNGHGIALRGDSRGSIIRSCLVVGNAAGNSRSGITFSTTLGGKYGSSNQVIGNEVYNFFEGIIGSGGLKGGGLVENNYVHDARPGGEDGIVAKRGNFEGLLIRHNEITGWRDDGIDLYGGINVIVEYNKIHDVAARLNGGGTGIKAGGANAKSENCIIRYNTIYNINSSSSGVKGGISSNGGDKLKIYGNLIYSVQGEAISIPSGSSDVAIYHNTAISNTKQALFVAGSGVVVRNNIFWGSRGDMNTNASTKGNNNLFINGSGGGRYSGRDDIRASASVIFANPSRNDYRLKSGSPAMDKGTTIAGYDKSIENKFISGRPDIGAYEYGGQGAPPPPAPAEDLSVNAGQDVSIQLPTNSVSLPTQVSGTNGTSVSYRWTKKSGPTATLSKSTTAKLEVSDMNEGTYVFTVTAKVGKQSDSDDVRVTVQPRAKPSAPAPPPPSGNNGLRYRYYEGVWPSLPNFANQSVRREGTVANFNLDMRQREDDFGVVFTGSLQIDVAGTYTLYVRSDDGTKLYLDNKLIVDNDGRHSAREKSGSIYLSRGRHRLRLAYFEWVRNKTLEVYYAGPGISKRLIPNGVLYPGEAPPVADPPRSERVTAHAGSDKSVSAKTQSVSLFGFGKGPHSFRKYKWKKVDGPSVRMERQNTANLQLHNLQVGTYVLRFTATDSKGNTGSDDMTLTVGSGNARLADVSSKRALPKDTVARSTDDALLAYPNPAHRSLTVRVATEAGQPTVLLMRDMLGKEVRSLKQPAGESKSFHQFKINTKSLPPGVYVLQRAHQPEHTMKVIVEHQ